MRGGRNRGEGSRVADPDQVVFLRGVPKSPHPWIWKTHIDRARLPKDLVPGQPVRIVDAENNAVGRGTWHPHVTIALRILTRNIDEPIDQAFLEKRLRTALSLRRDVLRVEEATNAYRLCHGEADNLSGLVVDVLGDVVVAEVMSLGMSLLEEEVRAALKALFPDKRLLVSGDRRGGDLEGFAIRPREDDPTEVEVTEHGVRYKVDLREGHKTGFFCDQRDNRAYLARMCRGRTVYDLHTYTGGFALNALQGGAKQVVGVDLDEKAIAVATRNAKLNQAGPNLRFAQADAFTYLRELERTGTKPEVLVLDPPKLARDRDGVDEAMRTYNDLNRLGLGVMADDGIFVSCSCSGAVSEEMFLDVLRRAAAKTKKELTLLRVAGASPDHPVALHIPESGYLKVVFARVRSL